MSSFTILTTEANQLLAEIHDRMPVILDDDAQSVWLEAATDTVDLMSLLVPYPASKMESRRISTDVNKASNDYPELLNSL